MRPPRGLPPSVTWVKSVNLYCTYNLMKMSLRKCNRKSLTTPTAPTGWTALSPFNPRSPGRKSRHNQRIMHPCVGTQATETIEVFGPCRTLVASPMVASKRGTFLRLGGIGEKERG